ncbi:hypothetical protein [Streptomyces sp. NPDC005533]|uniref:hypothetical protein n=1 Tax=Streptomyces sp. NPDC005533 TaxID=3364723 RepID=UPI0036CF19B5
MADWLGEDIFAALDEQTAAAPGIDAAALVVPNHATTDPDLDFRLGSGSPPPRLLAMATLLPAMWP